MTNYNNGLTHPSLNVVELEVLMLRYEKNFSNLCNLEGKRALIR